MKKNNNVPPIVMTDASCGWDSEYAYRRQVPMMNFSCIFADYRYDDCVDKEQTALFYQRIIKGEECTTQQATSKDYHRFFNALLQQKRPIVYIAGSSSLSASYASACRAKRRLCEQYPDADITIIDSRAVCCGLGLLVEKAAQLRDEGKSAKEIGHWLQVNKLKVHIWLALDNFETLLKGGRIAPDTAFICNYFHRRALLCLDKRGNLIPVAKCRKEIKLFKKIARRVKKESEKPESQVAIISHAFCQERAEQLQQLLLDKVHFHDVDIRLMSTVLAAHTGPSGLLLCFWGKKRS
jgi:DegV family protein with EDD domain